MATVVKEACLPSSDHDTAACTKTEARWPSPHVEAELPKAAFSPAHLVNTVVSMMSGWAERKGLTLTADVAKRVPRLVTGDEARLRQVLVTLVNNALKFTNEGGVEINLFVQSDRLASAGRLVFSVRDSGIGIPVAQQARLFQRSTPAEPMSARPRGTASSLAVSQQLVRSMGGEIRLQSQEGEGSHFWFVINLDEAPCAQTETVRPAQARLGEPLRILIADDTDVNQELAKAILERDGHSVTLAANGIEALQKVRTEPIDIVFMDVNMPVMDGLVATATIRASRHKWRHLPIVALTANVLPDQVTKLRNAGMDGHVGKPFRRRELLAAIDLHRERTAACSWDGSIFEELQAILGPAKVRDILRRFLEDLGRRFAGGLANRVQLSEDAHAVTSVAGTLGFSALAAACRAVETACRKNTDCSAAFADLVAARDDATRMAMKILNKADAVSPAV